MKKKYKYEFDGEFKFLEHSPYMKYWLLISIICTTASVYMVIYSIISENIVRWYAMLGFSIISDMCVYLHFSKTLRYLNKLLTISTTGNYGIVRLHLFELIKNGDRIIAGLMSVAFNAIVQFFTCITYNQGRHTSTLIIAGIFCLLYNFCHIINCSKTAFNILYIQHRLLKKPTDKN